MNDFLGTSLGINGETGETTSRPPRDAGTQKVISRGRKQTPGGGSPKRQASPPGQCTPTVGRRGPARSRSLLLVGRPPWSNRVAVSARILPKLHLRPLYGVRVPFRVTYARSVCDSACAFVALSVVGLCGAEAGGHSTTDREHRSSTAAAGPGSLQESLLHAGRASAASSAIGGVAA